MKKIINVLLLVMMLVMVIKPIPSYAETDWELLQKAFSGENSTTNSFEFNEDSGVYTIKLNEDIECPDESTALEVADGKAVVLDLNGHVLDTGRRSQITVYGNLTIQDSNPSAEHSVDKSDYPWKLDNNGTEKVYGGIAPYITIKESASCTMVGGNIVACDQGVRSSGTFTMIGGIISGNGCGVEIERFGSVILGGNSVIDDNCTVMPFFNIRLYTNLRLDTGSYLDASTGNYLPFETYLTISETNPPIDGMKIGIQTSSNRVISTNSVEGFVNYFKSDITDTKVDYVSDTDKRLKYIISQTVSIASGIQNGTVISDCGSNKVFPGATVTLTVTPDSNCELKAGTLIATANSNPVTLTQDATDATKYTFIMPEYAVNVKAEFLKNHVHNIVYAGGRAATETEDGWKDYYKCTECEALFEDVVGNILISDFDLWKSKGGKGFLARLKSDTEEGSDSSSEQEDRRTTDVLEEPLFRYYSNDLQKENKANNVVNGVCLLEQQGPLCVAAFKRATPNGYTEAFSFNFCLKSGDKIQPNNDRKVGKFVINIPKKYQKKGRVFKLIGIDGQGKTKMFSDGDINDTTFTTDLDIMGYAFLLIYSDSTSINNNELNRSVTNGENTYYVKSGDTLSGIAKKFSKTVKYLVEVNNVDNPDKLYINQKIMY